MAVVVFKHGCPHRKLYVSKGRNLTQFISLLTFINALTEIPPLSPKESVTFRVQTKASLGRPGWVGIPLHGSEQ